MALDLRSLMINDVGFSEQNETVWVGNSDVRFVWRFWNGPKTNRLFQFKSDSLRKRAGKVPGFLGFGIHDLVGSDRGSFIQGRGLLTLI